MDLDIGFELAIGLEITCFVGGVSVDDVGAVVLEISEGEEDNVSGNDPDLAERREA